MKRAVLLCGVEDSLCSPLKSAFRKENFIVHREKDPGRVIDSMRELKPEVTVLTFDTAANLDLCRGIAGDRKKSDSILVVVGNENENKGDIISGLKTGVEDYILRPVDTDIFMVKLKAIMRRLAFREKPDEMMEHDGMRMNVTSHRVLIDDELVDLTPKEFALLYYLLRRKGKPLSRKFLMESVWDQEYLGDPRTVNKHVETLRRKIGSHSKRIETVQGIGYRFRE